MSKRVLYVVRLLLLRTFVLPLYSAACEDETKTEEETPSYQSVITNHSARVAMSPANPRLRGNNQSCALRGPQSLTTANEIISCALLTDTHQPVRYTTQGPELNMLVKLLLHLAVFAVEPPV